MSLRGNVLLKPPRSKEQFKMIQEELLVERLEMIAKACGINGVVPTITPRLHRATPRVSTTTPQSASPLGIERPLDSDPLTQYQSRERPLMISADHLSTVFAALDLHGLREATTVIYGKYLVSDEQMITSTMLQLREAMKTKNKVCLFVDCESLIASMLDVLNGFYQRDDGDAEFMVRVVLDGRSDDWPITPGFNMRCIMAVIDSTTFATFDSGPNFFTPALESRFEKIFVTADMFEAKPKSRVLASLRDNFEVKYLGYTKQNSIDAEVVPEIIGYHPLMLACSEEQHHSIELLGRSDVVMMHTQLPSDIALDNVVALDRQQSLVECVSRHVNDTDRLYSLVLCPVGHIRGGSGLESLAQAQAVAALAVKEIKGDVRSLTIRSGTLDMLFEIAVRNLLAAATTVVIAISHSQNNPLEESHLLAVCNFVAAVAEERNTSTRIILFAPISHIDTKVTIPHKWRASYCDSPIPFTVPTNFVESRCNVLMPQLRCIEVNTTVRYDVFPKNDNPSFWETFEKTVKKSTSSSALQHVRRQVSRNISISQAIAEINAYQEYICKLRCWLSLHWSNHKYFARLFGVRWDAIRSSLLLSQDEILSESFILSPSREGGLPAAQSIMEPGNGTMNQLCIVQCNSLQAQLRQCMRDRKEFDKALDIQHCITQGRLSGAQSNAELLALLRLSLASKEPSINGSRVCLPFTSQQMSSLRTFEAIAPSTTSERLHLDSYVDLVNDLLCAESEMTRAVALAQLCKALCARHQPPILRRVQSGQLSTESVDEQVPKDELFVRIAFTYGMNLAVHIFCNPPDSSDAFETTISACGQIVALQTKNDLRMALNRSFQWDPMLNNDEYQSPTRFQEEHDEISSIRAALEREPRLSHIGHYVYLYRVLKEQLFTVDPLAPTTGKPDEQLIGIVTLDMIRTLCIKGLPKSLQTYLQRLLTVDHCDHDRNVLDVFEHLRKTLLSLIKINNDILKRCHAVLKRANNTEVRRTVVEWPLLTIHHQLISIALFNEVWRDSRAVTRDRLRHFEEVLGGLPEITLLEHFPSQGISITASFQSEPSASEVFS
ncbi:Hypothetical protein, putative [Bodo saltans]|nr:Hypothetical protein, putative [Bodo saltans]|eukprot:CUG81349.1 Hypothetical protein, putative [Bodo saltans]